MAGMGDLGLALMELSKFLGGFRTAKDEQAVGPDGKPMTINPFEGVAPSFKLGQTNVAYQNPSQGNIIDQLLAYGAKARMAKNLGQTDLKDENLRLRNKKLEKELAGGGKG